MKIKQGFVLRELGDASVVVAIGKQAESFSGIITLNESAKVLWQALEGGADMEGLVKSLTDVYEVEEAKARESCEKFVAKLESAGIIE